MPPRKPKQPKAEMLRSNLALNEGHDRASEQVRADPMTGARVVVLHNDTQRRIDRLLHDKLITAIQAAAGNTVRDAWEGAGIVVAGLRASPWRERVQGKPSHPEIADEAKWREYTIGWNALGRDGRRCVRACVLWDEDPVGWGQRHRMLGLEFLRSQLDILAKAYGLVS